MCTFEGGNFAAQLPTAPARIRELKSYGTSLVSRSRYLKAYVNAFAEAARHMTMPLNHCAMSFQPCSWHKSSRALGGKMHGGSLEILSHAQCADSLEIHWRFTGDSLEHGRGDRRRCASSHRTATQLVTCQSACFWPSHRK
eukprot:67688-Pleurochrysis_carterae.AAC.1